MFKDMKDGRNTFYELNAFIAGSVATSSVVIILFFSNSNVEWKNHWDTVLTVAVTAIVGVGSVIAVLHQIKISQVLEQNQRLRRNYAQRAALSHPLSNILKIQKSLTEELWNRTKDTDSTIGRIQPISFLTKLATEEDTAPLINCISDAENYPANDISRLVALLQIQNARIEDNNETICKTCKTEIDVITIYGRIVDSLLIYARAQRLLFYARRNDIDYGLTTIEASLQSTLWLLFLLDENSDFQKILNGRIECKDIMWFE